MGGGGFLAKRALEKEKAGTSITLYRLESYHTKDCNVKPQCHVRYRNYIFDKGRQVIFRTLIYIYIYICFLACFFSRSFAIFLSGWLVLSEFVPSLFPV